MLPHPRAVVIEERARFGRPARAVPQGRPVVTAWNEADLLALRLVGGRQPQTPRYVAHFGLCHLPEREHGVRQLVLPQAV